MTTCRFTFETLPSDLKKWKVIAEGQMHLQRKLSLCLESILALLHPAT